MLSMLKERFVIPAWYWCLGAAVASAAHVSNPRIIDAPILDRGHIIFSMRKWDFLKLDVTNERNPE